LVADSKEADSEDLVPPETEFTNLSPFSNATNLQSKLYSDRKVVEAS
jgi:hypothetical protein